MLREGVTGSGLRCLLPGEGRLCAALPSARGHRARAASRGCSGAPLGPQLGERGPWTRTWVHPAGLGPACGRDTGEAAVVTDPVCEIAKETQMYRTVFWTLWERARVG